jgi:beta-lactamase class A
MPDGLRAQLLTRIASVPGAEVGFWFQDLVTGETLGLRDTLTFHAASTMKVAVMVELMRRADAGRVDLDTRIRLGNDFHSIVDGSVFHLRKEDDSDPALYDRIGAPISLRELNHRMIVRSSNLATNALLEYLTPDSVATTLRTLGFTGVTVRRGVEDTKAYEAGRNNTVTARGLGELLAAIETGRLTSRWATTHMRWTLLRQEFNEEIPAGLPPGVRVAHKTGWITGTTHDAAIVYAPGRAPFVLVILTRSIPDRAVAQGLIADLARITFDATRPAR